MNKEYDLLAQASVLIRAKEYKRARNILQKLKNNQTAQEWLVDLDSLDPQHSKTNRIAGYFLVTVGAVLLVVLGALALNFFSNRGGNGTALAADDPAQSQPAQAEGQHVPIRANIPQNCETEAQLWWTEAEPMVIQFLNLSQNATKADLTANDVLNDLQATHEDFMAMTYPRCMEDVRDNLSDGMLRAISGFEAGQPDNSYFDAATQHFANAYEALNKSRYFTALDVRMSNTAVLIWGGRTPYQLEQQ